MTKDPTGKFFVQELHKVAAGQGQGYVDYQYAKPGAPLDQPSPKLSFVKYFAPWRWTVGTGVYVDDLSAKIWSQVLVAAGLASGFVLVIGLVSGWVVLGLSNRLTSLGAAMGALAAGDPDAVVPKAKGRDEIDRMTDAVHVFQQAAREKSRLESSAAATRAEAESSRLAYDKDRADRERKLEEATNALGRGLEKLSGGDLAFRIDTPFEARLDKLRLDFNAALERLRQTMLSVRADADGIRSGVAEFSRASQDLSGRTEQQAAQLEETAAAVDEIAATLKTSAAGVKNASQMVQAADNDAKEGAIVVKRAIEAMDEIAKSSQQIAQIISVIDEIAFQTNLLALNAGVEAARAGEAGRGFAVVASEVRALAQRSAEAAKEIKALISASAAHVESGVELVTGTGGSLERIITRVSEINRVVAEIASGADEQSSGIQQVNAAINAMDQATQQNATMAEQANAASSALAKETAGLTELIGQFNLGAAAEPDLRRELQKAAPHAFAEPPRPPKRAPAPAARAPAPRPAVKLATAKAGGGRDDWSEF